MDKSSQLHGEVYYGSCYNRPSCISWDLGNLRNTVLFPPLPLLAECETFLNTLHSQMRWLPLHTMQRGVEGVADVEAGLCVPLDGVLAAKVLEATLVFTTELVLSSVLAFDEVCFIELCASAFSFDQSLKSRSVGLTQCFFTVKSDQDSFRLGGNICSAVLRSEALLRPESYESDLKSPT